MKMNRREFIEKGILGFLVGVLGAFGERVLALFVDSDWHHVDCWWDEDGVHGRDAWAFGISDPVFVDSATGDDQTGAGTSTRPYATLAHAVEQGQGADIVLYP